jgi:class 3 adenylate cyclase/pimeloyl-ACP methyl ester carboxylesterase
MTPEPAYVVTSDGAHIAYEVIGDGPIDILWLSPPGHLDIGWESPFTSAWYQGLASFARLILHDRRGTGLSSRDKGLADLETQAADLRCVLDHLDSRDTVIGGWFDALAPGVLLAASDPERVRALTWWNPCPRSLWAPDYEWGWDQKEVDAELGQLALWGTEAYGRAWADQYERLSGVRPTPEEERQLTRESRSSSTPDVAEALARIWWATDLRGVLPSISVPTLLLADTPGGNNREVSEYVASLMPDAQIQLVPNEWPEPARVRAFLRPILDVVREFIGVEAHRTELDSVLAAVLFTDIVNSTNRQAVMGDTEWKHVVEAHHEIVRDCLARWGGTEQDTAGDSFFARFDGPARAVRCALEVAERVSQLDLAIRAGVHIGECQLIDGKLAGLAVTIGARIAALAAGDQVLVSQTVKDLVAGSGLVFEDAGERVLKGVPEAWRLYSVLT